jgi:hypothetical protein
MDGVVYYTDAQSPYEVLRYNAPDSRGYTGTEMKCLWETAWMDLGKDMVKRDFVLRFTAEADAEDLPVDITLETDRREKKKTVLLKKRRADYRVKIQSAGVRVKMHISSKATAGWRIYGGVQVEYSMDEV